MSRRAFLLRTAVRVGGYLILLAPVAWPLFRNPAAVVPLGGPLRGWLPGDGDPWNFLWRIDWVWRHPASLLDPAPRTHDIFFPFGSDLTMLRGMLLQGIVALCLRPVGDVVLAHNVMWALSFLLTALTTATLAEAVSGSRPGAFVAGAFLAFGPHFYVHSLQHSYKYVAFAIVPLALLALLRFLDEGSPRALAAFGIATAGLLLSDWYNVLYVGVAGGLMVTFRARAMPSRILAGRLGLLASLAVPLAGLALWSAEPVLTTQASTLVADVDQQARYSIDLLNLVFPPSYHAFWGEVSSGRLSRMPGNEFEKTAFLGWVLPVVLAGLCWRDRRDPRLRLWGALAAVFFILALGPWLQWDGRPLIRLPGFWLGQIPGFAASRAPGRYIVVSHLGVAVMIAVLIARCHRPRRVAALLLVTMAIEFAPFATPVVRCANGPALAALTQEMDGAVLDVPYRVQSGLYTALQTRHRRPLVGGYMIRRTARYEKYPQGLPGFEIFRDPLHASLPSDPARLRAALSRLLGVRWLVVHKTLLANSRKATRQLLAAGLGAEPWKEDGEVVVLRLADPAPEAQRRVHPGDPAFVSQVFALGWSEHSAGQIWGKDGPQLALDSSPPARAVSLELLPVGGGQPRQPSRLTILVGRARFETTLRPGWQDVVVPLPAQRTVPWVLSFDIDRTGCPSGLQTTSQDQGGRSIALRSVQWLD
jgi:hypothetical protein